MSLEEQVLHLSQAFAELVTSLVVDMFLPTLPTKNGELENQVFGRKEFEDWANSFPNFIRQKCPSLSRGCLNEEGDNVGLVNEALFFKKGLHFKLDETTNTYSVQKAKQCLPFPDDSSEHNHGPVNPVKSSGNCSCSETGEFCSM